MQDFGPLPVDDILDMICRGTWSEIADLCGSEMDASLLYFAVFFEAST